MKYGIIGALDVEISLVREKMKVTGEKKMLCGTIYSGTIYGQEIVLACAGMGKVNAALCAHTLIREFGAEAVINIGIAGAMAQEMHTMDVVIGTELCFHDQDPCMVKCFPFTETFYADKALAALAERACAAVELRGRVRSGRIITGDIFVNDAAVKARLVERFSPLCTEMEGAAVAHAAFVNQIPFLVIRTMSDSADDGADNSYDNFIDVAANQSASIILKMLELAE